MERVRDAVKALDPREAYLVSDRTVELLLQDGRKVRITAAEGLKGDRRFSADHEVAVEMQHDGKIVTAWASINLPWAVGDTAEDCLAQAILLMRVP